MATGSIAQRLLTFAFTDLVGSTRLWERAPEAARQAIARHFAIIQAVVEAHHGTVFKTVGDASYCVFEGAPDAVRAAIAIQRRFDSESWPEEAGNLRIRIGIHSGEAISEQGDYFGPTLNRVSRLMSAGHGGQILVSASTAQIITNQLCGECDLRDLGSHRLKDLAEPQAIFQVLAEQLPADFPPIVSLDARPNNLPSQISAFIGRDAELQQLQELLQRERLVTICGSAGIGKTRLALQSAAESIGKYKDGSWLVRLADIADEKLVPQIIASTLHIDEAPGESLDDTLVEQLRARTIFLLLDNAEHVLAAAARVARRLLHDCPGMTILVTSREPLHLPGEHVLRIARLVSEDATHLFAQRANLAHADTYVQRICDKLDYVPLAIELVAARIGTLTTKQLDSRLESILPVLASKDPTQEERHRTVRAAIEWSYRLLNPKEQRFFALLSVFDGGFTLEACEAVAWAGEEQDPSYVLLDALVDKSFVAAEADGLVMRYRLLESLHEFARSKLAESGEGSLAKELHFEYFKSLADRWGKWASGEEEREYLAAISQEIPNLRAGLEWGFSRPDKTRGFDLLFNVGQYWQRHCNISEARSWYARALQISEGDRSVLHAGLLRRAATLATIEDDYDAARSLTEGALSLFRDLGDERGAAEALHNLAVIEQRSGSEDAAYELYREALDGFERTRHEIGAITALYNLALTSLHQGDLTRSSEYLERGMALCNSPEHADRLASFWSLRGELLLQQGAMEEARGALERALAMKRELHDRHDEVENLTKLATLNIRSGDLDAAIRYGRESLQMANELGLVNLKIGCFELFAVIFSKTGREQQALRLLGLSQAMRRRHGYVFAILSELAADLAAIPPCPPADDAPEEIERVIRALIND
jgi:predicted ATPase/class 3 adenylate cyclase